MVTLKYLFCVSFLVFSSILMCSAENLADVQCGRQWLRGSRIVGGENANPGEFPWLVSITRRGGHFCGGTLVHRRWVVTAAHCMCSGTQPISAGDLRISVGAHDIRSKKPAAQEVRVSQIVTHPAYKCARYEHDLALLELSLDVQWTPTAWPACLPGAAAPRFSAEEVTVAGWGWMHESSSTMGRADVLQKVKLQVVDNEQCRDWFKSQGKKYRITDSQMCAGYEVGGRDSCWADSGGPLMVGEGNDMTVVGVVSTGIGCARPRLPGIYTRISEYVPWIRQHVLATH